MMLTYKKNLLLLVFNCLLCSNMFAQSDSATEAFTFLPKSHIVPLFTADTRSHRLSLHKPFNDVGYIGSMGGIFPLVNLNKWNKQFQFSAASTVYTTLDKYTNRGYLVNVDFFVDFFFDVKLNDIISIRSGLGHTSQHLADDAVSTGLVAINYTRDYGQLFLVLTLPEQRVILYGGGILNTSFRTDVNFETKAMFQAGFEHSPVKWYQHNYLYYAADVKFRGELNFGTTQNIQLGYKYARLMQNTFRLCLNYTSGYEERGQFYNQKNKFVSLGMYFDF